MAFRYSTVVFSTSGTFTYTMPPDLYGLELIVRGGGGGGASGQHDPYESECFPGMGGGGGGCTFTERVIRRDEFLTDTFEVRVGDGGSGGVKFSNNWMPGYNGGASWFGDFYYAGGGIGGGQRRNELGYYRSQYEGGLGGYGMVRGGQGIGRYDGATGGGGGWFNYTPWRFSAADSFNQASMAAGGGGGGRGHGTYESGEDEEGDPEYDSISATNGGSSGAYEASRVDGANGPGTLPHWQTLQSGCGGNGSSKNASPNGGNGGFPSGGGGGGQGSDVLAYTGNGGNGARGCVTVIEVYSDED